MRADDVKGGLLVAAALLLPLNVEMVLLSEPGWPDLQHRVSLFLFDLPLLILAGVALWSFRPSPVPSSWGPVRWLASVLFGLVVVSLLFHPSARGEQTVVRLVLNIGVPVVVLPSLSRPWTRRVVGALFVGVVFEAALGLVQGLRNATLGLTFLGENPPLRPMGTEQSAKGTFVHPYVLAGFAAVVCAVAAWRFVGTPRRRYLLVTAAAAVPFGITHSRMAVLAGLAVVACLLVAGRQDRRAVLAALALVVGAGLGGALTWGGWIAKVDRTAKVSTNVDVAFSGRATFSRQADDLIRSQGLVGVGPGRYVIELEEREELFGDTEVLPVHNVPLLVAAESGIPAGIVAAALLLVIGWQAWRRGPVVLGLYAAYLPFLLFDHFPYDNAPGLVLTGMWLGLLIRMFDSRRPDDNATDDEPVRADAELSSPRAAVSSAGA